MHKHLIIKAFRKAEKDLKNNGNNTPSLVNISNEVENKTDFSLGARMYRNYFIDAERIVNEEDINIKQQNVVKGLYQYLGFESYTNFVASLPPENRAKNSNDDKNGEKTNIISIWLKKNKIVISISALIITFILIKVSINQQRWMIWEKDHYTEAQLDVKKHIYNQLKEYDQNLIKSFKKINSPDCNTVYLTAEGHAKVWYWKKNNEEIELYTSAGLHPTNGKTLKPITRHMIRKYICSD